MSDLVSELHKKKIKLLAIDFDQTLLTIHTGGMWKGEVEKLLEHVRPSVIQLIEAALVDPTSSVCVCIVTYSMQPWLIRELLNQALPHGNTSRIIVRGNTPDWTRKSTGWQLGKEEHISSVVTELYNRSHAIIKPENILLLDDDQKNIEIAKSFQHRAFQVDPNFTLDQFREYLATLWCYFDSSLHFSFTFWRCAKRKIWTCLCFIPIFSLWPFQPPHENDYF